MNYILSTIIQISIPSYFLHKLEIVSFPIAFLGFFAFLHWDTIGITVLAMYVVHRVISYLQKRKAYEEQGRIVGGMGFGTNASTPYTRTGTGTGAGAGTGIGTTIQNKTLDERNTENVKSETFPNPKMKQTKTKKSSPKPTSKKRKSHTKSHHRNSTTQTGRTTSSPPPLTSSKDHPGLTGFHLWMSAMSDLYRLYTIGTEGNDSPIPIVARSENGRARIALYVYNQMTTSGHDIDVYWVNYKGKEVYKGTIHPYSQGSHDNWSVITWVGHPWTFRRSHDQQLLLHFVPLKVPHVTYNEAKVIESLGRDTSIGHYEFAITEPDNRTTNTTTIENENENENATPTTCSVADGIFPYPPEKTITTVNHALEYSCQQMEREEINPRMVLKYIHNIVSNPTESKYRQIRTNNKVFWNNVWITSGRGIFHALGFEEHEGYVEMGPNDGSLPNERLKDLGNAVVMMEELGKDMEDSDRSEVVRPIGTNGFSGRAGWRI